MANEPYKSTKHFKLWMEKYPKPKNVMSDKAMKLCINMYEQLDIDFKNNFYKPKSDAEKTLQADFNKVMKLYDEEQLANNELPFETLDDIAKQITVWEYHIRITVIMRKMLAEKNTDEQNAN